MKKVKAVAMRKINIYLNQKKSVNEIRKTNSKEFYIQILTQLERAFAVSKINKFEDFSFISYINQHCDIRNPATLSTFFSTLVILACECNKVKILEYVFDQLEVLTNNSDNIGGISPDDEDESSHNAFYYAIRSGNVELLNTLINKWIDIYDANNLTKLDEILSRAYEELKLRNVPLSDEIEVFVENKLVNLRFFSTTQFENDINVKVTLSSIKERIRLVLESISILKSTGEVDKRFFFIAQFVAQNVHILKRQLKSTYSKLPWEEIEFCLIVFISSQKLREDIDLIYTSILTKEKILLYLEHFATKLNETAIDETDVDSKLPNLKRADLITDIVGDFVPFECLYNDFKHVKDIYSLEKIGNNIQLALTVNPKKEEGRLLIARTLQVTGEYLKNTLESPNISNEVKEILLSSSLQKNTDKVFKSCRNVLSHFYSLEKRIEFEESEDFSYFSEVQNNLKKMNVEINYLREKSKSKAVRMFLNQIIDNDDSQTASNLFHGLISILPDLEKINLPSKNYTNEIGKLKSLVDKLCEQISDKTPHENDLFNQIKEIINLEESKLTDAQIDYLSQIFNVIHVVDFARNINGRKSYSSMKYAYTSDVEPQIQVEHFKNILNLVTEIRYSITSRSYSSKLVNVNNLILINNICYTIFLEMDSIKGIEVLKTIITKNNDDEYSIATETNVRNCKAKHILNKRLGTLKDVLSRNEMSSDSDLIKMVFYYKKNKKLQLIVEMLVLDIMEILQHLGCLGNNLLFLDNYSPILIGKSLRNHLAHGNSIINILQCDTATIVISNALKLIQEEKNLTAGITVSSMLGELFHINYRYVDNLSKLANQQAMFEAAREGDIDKVEAYISKGADVKARDVHEWTVFHFTACGGSLKTTKYFSEHFNLDINTKDTKNQTPLHIAASYGRANIVEFFITEKHLPFSDIDNCEKTPLHLAAEKGHTNVVKILLKHNSNIEAIDIFKLNPLHYAASNGYKDIVELFLFNSKITVNSTSNKCWTLLHFASLNGHLELVNYLLKKKSYINARTRDGDTPLTFAAQRGHNEVVKTLLKHKADINNISFDGLTPMASTITCGNFKVTEILLANKAKLKSVLHIAARLGYYDIVNILLKHGSKVDALTSDNNTALHLSASEGHFKVVQLLIDNNASINKRNNDGNTALHLAADGGYNNIVKVLLLAKAKVDYSDNNEWTPLHSAVYKCRSEVVNTLLANGANVNAINNTNVTPLHLAASQGSGSIAEALLAKGANINCVAINNLTPLFAAATGGHGDVVEILLKNGAHVNIKNKNVGTALYAAVMHNHTNVVKLLLAQGAAINFDKKIRILHTAVAHNNKEITAMILGKDKTAIDTRDEFGGTALHVACCLHESEIIKILLKYKADVNAKDIKLGTPLMVAVIRGQKNIVQDLLAGGANVNSVETLRPEMRGPYITTTPLRMAIEIDSNECVDILLENGADINDRDIHGNTPLHIAVEMDRVEIVTTLLSKGANVKIANKDRITPLHSAAAKGYEQIVRILLSYNAHVDARSQYGHTALHCAAFHDHTNIIDILLKAGANIDEPDLSALTPLFHAVQKGHEKATNTLLLKGANVDFADKNGKTPLHCSSQKGYSKIIEILLKHKANVNAAQNIGLSSLHFASVKGHLKAVLVLLDDNNINIDAIDAVLRTPVHYSSMFGHTEVTKALIKKGAYFDNNSINECTPLQAAVMQGHSEISELLTLIHKLFDSIHNNSYCCVQKCISKGVLVNSKSVYCETPLFYASLKGHTNIVRLLLENNAIVNLPIKGNMTPLHVATDIDTVKLLLTHGAVFNLANDKAKIPLDLTEDHNIKKLLTKAHELFEDAKFGNIKFIDKLKLLQSDELLAVINARNCQGHTLLQVAIINQNNDLASKLSAIIKNPHDIHQLYSNYECTNASELFKLTDQRFKGVNYGNDNVSRGSLRSDEQRAVTKSRSRQVSTLPMVDSKDIHGRKPLSNCEHFFTFSIFIIVLSCIVYFVINEAPALYKQVFRSLE